MRVPSRLTRLPSRLPSGKPFALGHMVLLRVGLCVPFKRPGWL